MANRGMGVYTPQVDGTISLSSFRRDVKSWRREFTPKLLQNTVFSDDLIKSMKKAAVTRQDLVAHMQLRQMGKALAKIPVPPLSFAFFKAAWPNKLTAELIIREV